MPGKAKVRFNLNFYPFIGDKSLHCLAVEVFFDMQYDNYLYLADLKLRKNMKKTIKYPIVAAIAAAILANSNSVSAQWIGPPVLVQQPLVDVVELNRFAAKSINNTNGQSVSKITKNPLNISLIFQPSIERRKINLAGFVKKSRAVDPVGAAEMEKLFASTDVIEMIAQSIAPSGLKVNNVADAYSVYWISAWNASRGRTETPSKAQISSVKNLVANAISATPAFTSANQSQKQEYAEALLIQSALIEAAMEKAGSNAAQLRAIAKAVRKGAKASGFDLDNMTLTEDGFVLSSKETGSLKTNNDNQLASASGEHVDSTSPNYILIAAAGGAGLGGMLLLGKAMGRKG